MGATRRAACLYLAASLTLVAAPMGQGAPTAPASTGTSASGNRSPPESYPVAVSPDTTARSKSRADTVLVVKHRFNHREQIITGSVVMSCLAVMMVVMNNYNPR